MKVNVDANFNCLLFVDLIFEITNGFEVKVSHFLFWYGCIFLQISSPHLKGLRVLAEFVKFGQ